MASALTAWGDPRGAGQAPLPARALAAVAAQRPDEDPASLWTAVFDAIDRKATATSSAGPGGHGTSDATTSDVTTSVAATIDRIDGFVARDLSRVVVVKLAPSDSAWVQDTGGLRLAVDALAARHPEASIRYVGPAAGDQGVPAVADLVAEAASAPRELVADALARAFGPEPGLLVRFLAALRGACPDGTAFALRGSAVLGRSYTTGQPFDTAGPGTSDLDIVAIGPDVLERFHPDARILGGLNTLPLGDGAEWIAPSLDPARRACQAMVGRPVSIQVMARWFLDLRAAVQAQPYVDLLVPPA